MSQATEKITTKIKPKKRSVTDSQLVGLPTLPNLRREIEDLVRSCNKDVTLKLLKQRMLWVASVGDTMVGSIVGPSDAIEQLSRLLIVDETNAVSAPRKRRVVATVLIITAAMVAAAASLTLAMMG